MKRFFASVLHVLLLAVWCPISFGQSTQNAAPSAQQAPGAPPAAKPDAPPSQPPGNSQTSPGNAQPSTGPMASVSSGTFEASALVQPGNWQCLLYATHFNIWRLEIVVTTLSTYRLQSCSPQGMNKISVAAAVAQLRTVSKFDTLLKGGAHQQIMTVNLTPINSEYYYVSNLKFSPIGNVRVDLKTLLTTTKLTGVANLMGANYRPFSIEGRQYYIWNIGTLAHRLVSPEGDKYLMMTFTTEVAPTLSRDMLSELGPMLNMPEGWAYESYFLDKTITIRSGPDNNNSIISLFDDLQNVYVKYAD